MGIFFSADPHFNHRNILIHANRPFADIDGMNDTIIENYNSIVGNGILYLLGDFAFKGHLDIINRLRCKIIYITGNHDKDLYPYRDRFMEYHKSYLERKINGVDFTLCHYAMRVWNKSHHGAYHLYGHSHGTLPDDPTSRSFDCGVDCWDYSPISFEQVVDTMNKKTWQPVDHHTGER